MSAKFVYERECNVKVVIKCNESAPRETTFTKIPEINLPPV